MLWFKDPSVHEFSDLASRGRGFVVRGERFVHHTPLELHESAAVSITKSQKISAGVFALVIAGLLYLSWQTVLLCVVVVLTAFYFLDLLFGLFLAYRSFSKNPEIQVSKKELKDLDEATLPSYTIFCPLYKEWQVLPQFVEAIQSLDYPKDKLQVMLQLEEDDQETVQHARAMDLPPYFEIVVVPNSKPKTKPKAMNYGLQFATGDIITIYDAEDAPETTQLKKVVVAFRKLPENVVCVQGKLNFYNPYQNLLTRMFTAEYSLWFDLILPGLQSINAPIPLGGTTNNFKKEILKELAGWDAYNVTEDCDLGMRLSKKGFRTAIVDSTTLEEANSSYHNWYRQRSRWIKGYMQTYLVNMRSPRKALEDFGLRDFLLVQLTVGGKVLSMFVNPLLWLITIIYFAARTHVAPFIEPFFPPAVLYFGVVSLIFGNFFYIYAYLVGLAKRREFRVMKFVFLVPLYWLFMSAAAWKALYELLVKPHYWQKTVHGLHLKDNREPETLVEERGEERGGVLPEATASIALSTPETYPSAMSSGSGDNRESISYDLDVPETPVFIKSTVRDTQKRRRSIPFSIALLKQQVGEWLREARTDKVVREGALLVIASLLANFLNFVFNAILGRTLSLTDFGTVTLFGTIVGLMAIAFGALASSVTHRVAFLMGRGKPLSASVFNRRVLRLTFVWALLASLVWVLLDGVIANFFQVSDLILIWFFAPTLLFGALASVQSGFLKGKFSFRALGVAGLIEAVSKLGFALAFVFAGRTDLVSISIPASIAISFIALDWYAGKVDDEAAEGEAVVPESVLFPKAFFSASFLAGSASAVFMNIDVLFAKHFLSPEMAGAYALLSLVGKMIYLFGSLLTQFVNSIVSHHEGAETDPRKAFVRLFKLTVLISLGAYVGVGPLGPWTVPLLLGEKAVSIIPYLNLYGLAMVAFTLSSTLVSYRVARKHYSYAWVQLAITLAMAGTLEFYHASILQLTWVVLVFSVATLLGTLLWRAVREDRLFVLRNISDLLEVFGPLPKHRTIPETGKRILVFNWRDTKHSFAGGAETYIHELAKRWVEAGHEVTQFSGNDSTQVREEVIDGVQVIRRGGFYFVYVWAFVYYMLRFRGEYDLIIDCQNGVPFFTPFYAREPVYCLLHHVHQDVFHRYLPRPLALFAAFLEKTIMPIVYKDTKFITVSNSSQQDMAGLGLGLAGTQVIYPGVDLSMLHPGLRADEPTILYLGRLKAYKSVDVLIRAFEKVKEKLPTAKLIIAGGGEDIGRLQEVCEELRLCDDIDFRGKVSDAEKISLLQQAWVFVNPSMMEGWGITTIEANACGVPVVASDVPGLRESVHNPHTGYLVPYGDIDALAASILKILEQPELQSAMSKNAVLWAKQFNWELSAAQALKLIVEAGE